MSFDEITFFVGEGVARARATFHRTDPEKSKAVLTLTNVPASRLAFILPDFANRFNVPVDGRLTTSMGREWRGSGVLTASRGKIFGIPVTDVRMPVEWVAVPDRGRSEVRLRDVTATAAGGQLSGSLSVNSFNDLPPKLAGGVQFRNVNLSSAFRDAGQVIGNLPLSGSLDFGSDQYRGPDSLTANLRATLGESQPLRCPCCQPWSRTSATAGTRAPRSATASCGRPWATAYGGSNGCRSTGRRSGCTPRGP